MSLAVLSRKKSEVPAPAAKPKAAATGLRIGEPHDSFERDADRVADQVMAGGALSRGWSLSALGTGTPLQRKCDCGGSSECDECKKKQTLQRRATDAAGPSFAPPLVDNVLKSPGRPLDSQARAFFEPRFGHDFSKIRVHTDSEAAESARSVNALAYTVRHHVVMGSGAFAPQTDPGRRLLAHELAHAVQQGCSPQATATTPPIIARACLDKQTCEAKTEKTPEELMQEQTSDPANKSKRDQRIAACKKKPPEATCKSDGHGARAVQAEKVLHDFDPSRLKFIKQIVVDKDMESGFGALTGACSSFMPPIRGGGQCTFVPDTLEEESEQFNTTHDPEIGGTPRDLWRDATLETLMHETEHARFDPVTFAAPARSACTFGSIEDALSEIVAMMAEFPIRFRMVHDNVSLTAEERRSKLDDWFTWRITDESQSFKSALHSIYCQCECNHSEFYLKKTISFADASWSQAEKARFHGELQDPKWAAHKLLWPVAPPAVAQSPVVGTPHLQEALP